MRISSRPPRTASKISVPVSAPPPGTVDPPGPDGPALFYQTVTRAGPGAGWVAASVPFDRAGPVRPSGPAGAPVPPSPQRTSASRGVERLRARAHVCVCVCVCVCACAHVCAGGSGGGLPRARGSRLTRSRGRRRAPAVGEPGRCRYTTRSGSTTGGKGGPTDICTECQVPLMRRSPESLFPEPRALSRGHGESLKLFRR